MPVEYGTKSIGSLLAAANSQKLILPNFQRDYVWNIDAQKRLVASVFLDVPIGALLLLRGEPEDYVSRRIALNLDASPKGECDYVLDGQQRLSTLTAALSSPFNQADDWKTTWSVLPAKLRYVWCLRVWPLGEEQEADIFGYREQLFPSRIDVEPDDLMNFLEPTRVLVKDEFNESAWFHPNWGRSLPEDDRSLQIALAAAEHGLVPLWALTDESGRRLVDKSLLVIANKRCTELLAGANFAQNAKSYGALRDADPTLPANWHDAEQKQIERAFSSLAERWRTAMQDGIEAMISRRTPTIGLQREDVDRAIAIFSVINQSGTPLTPFDLIVAKHARHPDAKNLSQMLVNRLMRQVVPVGSAAWFSANEDRTISSWQLDEEGKICVSSGSLTAVFKDSFLNLLSLHFHSNSQGADGLDVKHIKKAAILKIPPEVIATAWVDVSDALLKTWAFLQLRCGIVSESDLRYKLMILPIAFSILRNPDSWENRKFHNRLEAWYWSALFGGYFRARQNENAITELKLLAKWLQGDPAAGDQVAARKSRVLNVEEYSDEKTLLLKDQDSAISSDISSAILQYILSCGPQDFELDTSSRLYAWQGVPLEDHHIIPLATAATLRQSASDLRSMGDSTILNSPLNRTLISKEANRAIGAKTPGQYLKDLGAHQPFSHLVPGIAVDIKPGDDNKVGDFLEQRFQRIQEAVRAELESLSH